jgi:hypothetical protein
VKTAFYPFVLIVLIFSGIIAGNARAFASDSKESMVKAAFIYNFVKFVEWPNGKKISQQANINICTLGESGVNNTSKVFQAASTDTLRLSLAPQKSWKSAPKDCHILFISGSEAGQMAQILSGLKLQPVLTVSDSENFVEQGGMIGFVVNDNKIKITVNTKAVTDAGLRVDAQLLEIALKVIDK